jgi:flagellin
MAVSINSNLVSLRTQRTLGAASREAALTNERLSSGSRINRASDDAAGLAVSTSLRTKARVYGQSIRNLNDGASLLSIADATLEQLNNIRRIRLSGG